MQFLLVVAIEQLQTIETEYPRAIADADYVVSMDLDVSARLWQLGIDHLQVSDILLDNQLDLIHEIAIKLLDEWFIPIENQFRLEDLSPLGLERMTMTWIFLQSLLAKTIIENLLKKYAIHKVTFFASLQRPHQASSATVDTFSAVWQYILETKSIELELLELSTPESENVQPAQIRKTFNILRHIMSNPILWDSLRRGIGIRDRGQIVLSVLNSEVYRFSEIAEKLREKFGNRVLFGISGGRSSGGIQTSTTVNYHSISLVPGLSYLRLLRMGKQWFKSWLLARNSLPDFPEIFQNSYLDYQFRYLFEERLPNAVQTYRDASRIFTSYKTALLISSSVSVSYANSIIQAAKDRHITTITLPHSGFVSFVEYQTPGDVTVSWTQDAAQAWQDIRHIESPVIGLPDSLVSRGFHQENVSSDEDATYKHITLLLATASVATVPYIDLDKHRQTLETIMNIPTHLQAKVKITLKLHPTADYQFLYEYLAEKSTCPQNIEIIRSGLLEEILRSSDLALLVNIPTSAFFLPLAMGIPELYINTVGVRPQTMRFGEWGGSAVIRQQDTIWKTIEATLFDEQVRENLLEDNSAYWERINAGNQNPMASLMNLISEVLT